MSDIVIVRITRSFERLLLARLWPAYLVFGLAGFALIWLLARLLNHDITQPHQHMARITQRVSQGDLREEVSMLSDDEVGQFAFSLTRMIRNLRGIVRQIFTTQRQIADIAAGIHETSGSLVAGTQDQSRVVTQMHEWVGSAVAEGRRVMSSADHIATAAHGNVEQVLRLERAIAGMVSQITEWNSLLEDTGRTVDRLGVAIAQEAEFAAQSPTQIAESIRGLGTMEMQTRGMRQLTQEGVELGRQVTQETIEGRRQIAEGSEAMKSIATRVDSARRVVSRLREKAEAIGNISAIINTVAEKTNLLALNAAIIASQAGEHGRGFAVIAQDIRSLSTGAQTSLQDIGTLIGDVQSEISTVVETIQSATQETERGLHLAAQSEEAIAKVHQGVQDGEALLERIEGETTNHLQAIQEAAGQARMLSDRAGDQVKRLAALGRQVGIVQAQRSKMEPILNNAKSALQDETKGLLLLGDSARQILDRSRQLQEQLRFAFRHNERIAAELNKLVEVADKFERGAGLLDAGFTRLLGASASLRQAVENFQV